MLVAQRANYRRRNVSSQCRRHSAARTRGSWPKTLFEYVETAMNMSPPQRGSHRPKCATVDTSNSTPSAIKLSMRLSPKYIWHFASQMTEIYRTALILRRSIIPGTRSTAATQRSCAIFASPLTFRKSAVARTRVMRGDRMPHCQTTLSDLLPPREQLSLNMIVASRPTTANRLRKEPLTDHVVHQPFGMAVSGR